MAIKLRQVLLDEHIAFRTWRENIKQSNGRELSPAGASLLLCQGRWLRITSAESIKKQTKVFFKKFNLDTPYGESLWEFEDEESADLATSNSQVSDDPLDRPSTEVVMLAQKTLKHFKLFIDPFENDVQGLNDILMTQSHYDVSEAMMQCGKYSGFIAVVGHPGAGKTILIERFQSVIDSRGENIVVIRPRSIDRKKLTIGALNDSIIYDASTESPKISPEAKQRQVEDILINGHKHSQNRYVILIDEGQDITKPTWKFLKRLREVKHGLTPLVGVIVVGQPEMKDMLDKTTNSDLREVIDRVSMIELQPLDSDIEKYLTLKFKRVNKDVTDVFEGDAYQAIYESLLRRDKSTNAVYSSAYPLEVNRFVKICMNMACDMGMEKITAELVGEV